jgi:hypothetical protein
MSEGNFVDDDARETERKLERKLYERVTAPNRSP